MKPSMNLLKQHYGITVTQTTPDEEYLENRAKSYLERFIGIDQSSLQRFDASSSHYSLYCGNNLIGGFRITPTNRLGSEVEEIFSSYIFERNSFEFGRFWIHSDFKKFQIGYEALDHLIASVSDFKYANSYLKAALAFRKKVAKLGYTFTGEYSEHPTLSYKTYLYYKSARNLNDDSF